MVAAMRIPATFKNAVNASNHHNPYVWHPTHRHFKGGYYRLIMLGNLEADMSRVAIYDNEKGQVFVRPLNEFKDGRFTALDEVK